MCVLESLTPSNQKEPRRKTLPFERRRGSKIKFNVSLPPAHHAALDKADLPYPERWEGSREGHHTPQAARLSGGRWDIIAELKETARNINVVPFGIFTYRSMHLLS